MRGLRRALFATVVSALALTAAAPARADFHDIARRIEKAHGARRTSIPFMGLGRLVVKIMQPDGILDFQIAVYEKGQIPPGADLQSIVSQGLEPGWKPIVRVRSKKGEQSFIFIRPTDRGMRLIVLAQDREETALIEVEMGPERFALAMSEPSQISGNVR